MKIAAHIAGALLGLAFAFFAALFLLQLTPIPEMPEGTPVAHFMAATMTTGFMTYVKVFELIGGICVALPWTRRLGLLILGPILVTILAYHATVMGGMGLFDPLLMVLCALALFLVWAERAAFVAFLRGSAK